MGLDVYICRLLHLPHPPLQTMEVQRDGVWVLRDSRWQVDSPKVGHNPSNRRDWIGSNSLIYICELRLYLVVYGCCVIYSTVSCIYNFPFIDFPLYRTSCGPPYHSSIQTFSTASEAKSSDKAPQGLPDALVNIPDPVPSPEVVGSKAMLFDSGKLLIWIFPMLPEVHIQFCPCWMLKMAIPWHVPIFPGQPVSDLESYMTALEKKQQSVEKMLGKLSNSTDEMATRCFNCMQVGVQTLMDVCQ